MSQNAWIAALLAAFGGSTAVLADDLSAEQQEIWDIVVACHDGWSASMAHKDFELFAKSCPEEPGTLWWYMGGPSPVTYGGPSGLWARSAPSTKSATWSDLEPVDVQVVGDVGLVYFSVVWNVEAADGTTGSLPSRRLSVLHRDDDGDWKLVGGAVGAGQ